VSLRRRGRGPFPWRVHPIWRGIGCLLLILVPIIAYGITDALLVYAYAQNSQVANNPETLNILRSPYLKVGSVVVLSMVLYLIFSMLGSVIYTMFGGPENENLGERTKPRPYSRR
jgi:hypothetical protein